MLTNVAGGLTTKYTYNQSGFLSEITDSLGKTEACYDFDAYGNELIGHYYVGPKPDRTLLRQSQ